MKRRDEGGLSNREVDEEIRFHEEMEAARLERQGLEREAAREEAARRLSLSASDRTALYAAAARRDRRLERREWARSWVTDAKQSLRALVRDPQFTVFVVVALALGIGANGAMFGVVDRLLLRGPDQVVNPGTLARLYLQFDEGDGRRSAPWIPYRAFEHVRETASSFSSHAAYAVREEAVELGTRTKPLRVSTSGSSYFETLGVRPHAGRFFGGSAAGDGADVLVLSHDTWQSDFGGRLDAIGGSVAFLGGRYTIIGIAPPGFTGPDLERVDAWVPIEEGSATMRNWRVVARLADGMSMARASDELAAAFANASSAVPTWARAGTMVARPLRYDDAGHEPLEASVSRLLFAVVGLVLLIACANVANLLLARVTRRRSEIAVRLAMGASRARLLRLMLSESLLLAVLGGVASLPVAWLTGDLMRRILLPQVEWTSSPLNPRVLLIIVAAVVFAGLSAGLLPGLVASGTRVAGRLQSAAREGRSRRRARLHLGLTVAQTALSAALLMGAGVFLRSYWRMHSTDLGVEPERVMRVQMLFTDPRTHPSGSVRERDLYDRALERVRTAAGVADAALAVGLPFTSNFSESVFVPGRDSIPALPGGGPYVSAVSPAYFSTVGTRMRSGRPFSEAEVATGQDVVIVSESMARVIRSDGSAIGACLRTGEESAPCSRVVGIAEDVHRVGYREPPSLQYYIPFGTQRGFSGTVLVVRLRGNAAPALAEVRSIVESIEVEAGYADIRPLSAFIEPQIRPWRLGATILTLCAALALLVAVTGVYGVLSYLVAQRRREIGVRMALGASRAGIGGLIVRTGTVPAAMGLLIGVAGTLVAARWLQPLLFETSVNDGLVIAAVCGTLLVSAMVACIVPASHASRVDPADCLGTD